MSFGPDRHHITEGDSSDLPSQIPDFGTENLPNGRAPSRGTPERYTLTLNERFELIVEPRTVSQRDEFLTTGPVYSITLDGRVAAPPLRSKRKKWINFDHHKGVNRLRTPCTSAQVLQGLKRGDLERIFGEGLPPQKISVLVNDCDLDVVLAIWLLRNAELLENKGIRKRIEALVALEDRLDRRGGAHPIDARTYLMRETAWINEPYANARMQGRIAFMNAQQMGELIEEMLHRLDQFAVNSAEKIKVDNEYRILQKGRSGWCLVEEIGFYARGQMVRDGIRGFVACAKNGGSMYSYTLWQIDARFTFPVGDFYEILNALEGHIAESNDCWGGSERGGGSPRVSKSVLHPDQIFVVLESYLDFLAHYSKLNRKRASYRNHAATELFIREKLGQLRKTIVH